MILVKKTEPDLDDAASEPIERAPPVNPRASVVAYHHDDNLSLLNSPWPQVWMQRMHAKFILRTQEASRNLGLRLHLLELLRAANEVIISKNCCLPKIRSYQHGTNGYIFIQRHIINLTYLSNVINRMSISKSLLRIKLEKLYLLFHG